MSSSRLILIMQPMYLETNADITAVSEAIEELSADMPEEIVSGGK